MYDSPKISALIFGTVAVLHSHYTKLVVVLPWIGLGIFNKMDITKGCLL